MGTWKKVGNIGETRNLRVAARGGTLYLYLPRDLVALNEIVAGDRVEARLGDVHREIMGEEVNEAP